MRVRKPVNRTEEQQRLYELVRDARKLSVYPNIIWDSACWELLDRNRAHDKRRLRLHFTRRRPNNQGPFEQFNQPFADFAKALIRIRASLRGVAFSRQKSMIITIRYLYEALLIGGMPDPTRLTLKHFKKAVADAIETTEPWSAYSVGKDLKTIADFVDENRITRTRLSFHNPIISPATIYRLDGTSQAEDAKKMPSSAALEALANISSNPLDDDERVLLRTIDLLVVGGFRIGEVLTLPVDCWVGELARDQDGKPKKDAVTGKQIIRYGLRYWPEKGGEPVVKWLSDHAVQVAKRAVDELTRLCAHPRHVAAQLEQEQSRVPLSGHPNKDDLLSRKQLEKTLGLSSNNSVRFFLELINVKPFVIGSSGIPHLYRVRDIEHALLSRRGKLEVLIKPNGKAQMLSQSLCVKFINQFNSTRATLFFLPELIVYTDITRALGNDDRVTSVFSRRDLGEKDGTPMRIRTHAFRHWLNTLADKGGLSDVDLARWMGRRDYRHNAAYKHGTVEQRATWAREMIIAGELHGTVTDTYLSINDPVEKQDFLNTFVSVAHSTPYGVCTHDFALEPCRYHLNCLNGCSEYLRTKGDPEERRNLHELRLFTIEQLKIATAAHKNETWGASNWVDFNRRNLAGIEAALAVDNSDSDAIEDPVTVFPKGGLLGEAIEQ